MPYTEIYKSTGNFSRKTHGTATEIRRSLPGQPSFASPPAFGAAGLEASRYRLGCRWCISLCWVCAAVLWVGDTKGWMVWGLERWEKGGGQRRGWAAGWLTNCFVRWWRPFSNNNSHLKAHCLSAFHHHYLLSLFPSAASISSLLVRGRGMSACRTLPLVCGYLSVSSSRARPCFSNLSLSCHWCSTCSYISWVHLLGGWWLFLDICASTIRLNKELGLLLPCSGPSGPLLSGDSHPALLPGTTCFST